MLVFHKSERQWCQSFFIFKEIELICRYMKLMLCSNVLLSYYVLTSEHFHLLREKKCVIDDFVVKLCKL